MSAQPADFAVVTAVEPVGEGRFAATVDPTWAAPNGPNGGYLAAILTRAAEAVVDDAKSLRSLSCHFLRPPGGGPVEVVTEVVREGRSVGTVIARMLQDGKVCVVALAALGSSQPSAMEYADAPMPQVPRPEDAVETSGYREGRPTLMMHMRSWTVIGGRLFEGGDEAVTGGWITCAVPTPTDTAAAVFYCDAWVPAPYLRLTAPVPAPTIDLTVHVRAPLPSPSAGPGEPVLVEVVSTTSADGYFEEDARVWAPDGTLLAQSRQLALLRPAR